VDDLRHGTYILNANKSMVKLVGAALFLQLNHNMGETVLLLGASVEISI
jgi:ribosomal protein S2